MKYKKYRTLNWGKIFKKIKRRGGCIYDYIAALRGPDASDCKNTKSLFQGLLRSQISGVYSISDFENLLRQSPETIIAVLEEEQKKLLLADSGYHYLSHVKSAMNALKSLGGEVADIANSLKFIAHEMRCALFDKEAVKKELKTLKEIILS